jgi:hypothetical protein
MQAITMLSDKLEQWETIFVQESIRTLIFSRLKVLPL